MKISSPFVVKTLGFVLCERQWHSLEKVLLNTFCGLSFTFTSFEAMRFINRSCWSCYRVCMFGQNKMLGM